MLTPNKKAGLLISSSDKRKGTKRRTRPHAGRIKADPRRRIAAGKPKLCARSNGERAGEAQQCRRRDRRRQSVKEMTGMIASGGGLQRRVHRETGHGGWPRC